MAGHAAQVCDHAVRLDVLTVSHTVTRNGFAPFLPDPANPTIFFQKQIVFKGTNKWNVSGENIGQGIAQHHNFDFKWQLQEAHAFDPVSGLGPAISNPTGTVTRDEDWNRQDRVPDQSSDSCYSTRTGVNTWSPDCGQPPAFSLKPAPNGVRQHAMYRHAVEYHRKVVKDASGNITEFLPNPWPDSDPTDQYDGNYERDMFFINDPADFHYMNPLSSGTVERREGELLEITLSDPYSLADLLGTLTGTFPEFPDWDQASNSGQAEKGGILAGNASDGVPTQLSATLSRMKYRVAYHGPKGEKTTLRWIERFTPMDGTAVQDTHFEQEVTFSGEVQYMAEKVVEEPADRGRIQVLLLSKWNCQSFACAMGQCQTRTSSVDIRIGLGNSGFGEPAGYLFVTEANAGPQLSTPQVLKAFVNHGTRVIRENGVIRQVFAPQGLADVASVANGYEVRFYSNPGPLDPATGLYGIGGGVSSTIGITSPDGGNTLRVNHGNEREDVFAAVNGGWTLNQADGLRKESRTVAIDPVNQRRSETYQIMDADNQVVYEEYREWRNDLFGMGELLVLERIGGANSPVVTRWTYYDDQFADGAAYGKLKTYAPAGGRWERHHYDGQGRRIKLVAQFLNEGDPVGGLEGNNRVTEYDYTPVAGSDDAGLHPSVPRRVIDRLKGFETGRRYTVIRADEQLEILCQTPGAAWNAPDNLVTRTKTTGIPGTKHTRQVTQEPDGTLLITESTASQPGQPYTVVTWRGKASADGKAVVAGTRSDTLYSASGQVEMASTSDLESAEVLHFELHSSPDPVSGRFRTTQYSDGTSSHVSYNCCAVESMTSRDGTVTAYDYDILRRPLSTGSGGLLDESELDPAGNLLRATRTSGPDTIVLNEAQYDTSGWRTRVTVNGRTTTFTRNYQLYGPYAETTTYLSGTPGSLQRVEERAGDGSPLKTYGGAVRGVRYEYGIENPPGETVARPFTQEIRLREDGTDSAEWVKTYTDMLGRAYKTVYPAPAQPFPHSLAVHDDKGRVVKQVDPDGVVTLLSYNDRGELEDTAVDMNGDGVINYDGLDRISRTVSDITQNHGEVVRRTRTFVWATNSSPDPMLVATVETSLDGRRSWRTVGDAVSSTSTTYTGNGGRVITQTSPGGLRSVAVYIQGRLASITQYDASNAVISHVQYDYDGWGRRVATREIVGSGQNQVVHEYSYAYSESDELLSVTSPLGQTTSYDYDDFGRVTKVTHPDEGETVNEYFPTGELKLTYGARTYPVSYTYDYAGRVKTMVTWRDNQNASTAATTTWNYDPHRGWLVNKRYTDGTGPDYAYTDAGRLNRRVWARVLGTRVTTDYTHTAAGDVALVNYSDTTPDVAFAYDRAGRRAQVAKGGQVTAWAYGDDGEQLSESHTAGPLGGLALTYGYDDRLRRTALRVQHGQAVYFQQDYTYHAGRLKTVGWGAYTAEYVYATERPQLAEVRHRYTDASGQTTVRSRVTREYDELGRLTDIRTLRGPGPMQDEVFGFAYTYNAVNQRTQAEVTGEAFAGDTRWDYGYDDLGQVTSGRRKWAGGAEVRGQQFEYAFDDIGNRKEARFGDAASGMSVAAYTANNLNQYSQRTVPRRMDITGRAASGATVTVENLATTRQGDYFHRRVNVGAGQVWRKVDVRVEESGQTATETGWRFLPPSPEPYAHDLDGNLIEDGRFYLTWDAENRLVRAESRAGAPPDSRRRVNCEYDWAGRRVRKHVEVWLNGTWQTLEDRRYLYDGWNLAADFDAVPQGSPINPRILNAHNIPLPGGPPVTLALRQVYVWGPDLSGTLQGAGGVGGLVLVGLPGAGLPAHFAGYDGNGNVAGLVEGRSGRASAVYEYGPFGELVRGSGVMWQANPFRFSTKHHDDETGWLYYGYRYYDPSTGRWLSRDPIEEEGGDNLHGFVGNDPSGFVDPFGMSGEEVGLWTILWKGAPSWADASGFHWDTPPSQRPKPAAPKPTTMNLWQEYLLDNPADRARFHEAHQQLRVVSMTLQAFAQLHPADTFSVIAMGESVTGEKAGGGGRVVAAITAGKGGQVKAAGGVIFLLISKELLEKLKNKTWREAVEILKSEPCLAGRIEKVSVAATTVADVSKFERVKLSKGTRAQIWERSKAPDGKVYDPTGVEIKPGEPWQAGHRPGHKFSDAQQRAAQEGWDLETWRAYQRDPDIYRPEKARTNLGHQHESDW